MSLSPAASGGLPKINITTGRSTAEIYLHGAQVTGFQKNGEPPLLFLSRLSRFAAGKAIRGGVPICFPWFGPRPGDVDHGFARITEWELVETTTPVAGAVTVRLRLPARPASAAWHEFRTEFVVTVADTLTMELVTTNESPDRSFEFEDCLHSYFAVGDIVQVSVTGLKGAHYLDKTDQVARKLETADAICITAGNQPGLSGHYGGGGNPRCDIPPHDPGGQKQLSVHRGLESVDDTTPVRF